MSNVQYTIDFGTESNKPEFEYHYICKFNLFFTKISKYWLVYWCDFGANNSKKYFVYTNFSNAKNRSIGLWRGREGLYVGTVEKKKTIPLCLETSKLN